MNILSSQITGNPTVCLTVCLDLYKNKPALLALCEGNSPVTGGKIAEQRKIS